MLPKFFQTRSKDEWTNETGSGDGSFHGIAWWLERSSSHDELEQQSPYVLDRSWSPGRHGTQTSSSIAGLNPSNRTSSGRLHLSKLTFAVTFPLINAMGKGPNIRESRE